jgi:Caspase domain
LPTVIILFRGLAIFALVLFLTFDCPAVAQTGHRVALVVGISKYNHAPKLTNTTNDASDIAAALKRLGFEVDSLIDPDRAALESSIRSLGRRAEGGEATVFYYAGHALEVGGQNLLVPAPADIQSDRDLRFETVDLDTVLDSVSGRARVSLLILDSCRDNPFSKRLVTSSRSISLRGLGPIDAAAGTLIAFATAPGKTAEDGDAKNSPFTTALLHNIERPGLEVRRMLGEVRKEVREATAGRQLPWENSALEGEFYFKPPVTAPAASPKQYDQSATPVDPNAFQQTLKATLQTALPGMVYSYLETTVRRYGEERENKAQAGSRERRLAWRSGGRDSAFSAEQAALEGCQIHYGNPCILIAVNNTIANIPADGSWVGRSMSRVNYEGQFDPEQIPAIRPNLRARKDITEYLSTSGPKAVAIHPWGRVFISTGSADQRSSEADALKRCNDDPTRGGRNGPCFLYAIKNHVVLPSKIVGPREPAKTILEAVKLVAIARAEDAYRKASVSKVLTIEPESGRWFYWDKAPSTDIAERMSLSHCQIVAEKPCILVAKDDLLVAPDPLDAKVHDMERVRYAGQYRLDMLPFLARVSEDAVRRFAQLPAPKALALKGIPPRYIDATGATIAEAERKALLECNQIAGTPCVLYAVDNQVVLPQGKTLADP